MRCPVCDDGWPDDAPRCTCGFDFTTRDPSIAIVRFERDARHGNAVWRRGLVALAFLPVTFFLLQEPTAILFSTVQLLLAAVWIVQGLVKADVANRKLSAAKQLIQLPAARVVASPGSRARSAAQRRGGMIDR